MMEQARDVGARAGLPGPYPIGSFRGNVVVETGDGAPWAEETWAEVEVGGVRLRKIKESARPPTPLSLKSSLPPTPYFHGSSTRRHAEPKQERFF